MLYNEIFLLVWITIMGMVMSRLTVYRTELVCGEEQRRLKPLAAIVFFAPIVWTMGWQVIDADKWAYVSSYLRLPADPAGIWQRFLETSRDPGFTLLEGGLRLIAGDQYRLAFLILAAIQGLCIVSVFRRYSINYFISVFLFFASTTYTWMFNGIRQFTAVTIIFAATPLMLQKRYWPLIFIILLASTIHQSALIMIPLVLIASGQAWNKKTWYSVAAILTAILFIDQFTNLLDEILAETNYAGAVDAWTAGGDNGANPIRVVISMVPVILAYMGRKKIRHTDDPLVNLCINMSILSAGLTLIAVFTSGIYIGRLPIYITMYGYILLPWLIQNGFEERSKRLITVLMILFYLLYGYYGLYGI